MPERFAEALPAIEALAAGELSAREKLQQVVEVVRKVSALYSWVGIYYLRGPRLELGPYSGLPTVHTRIPVGAGVCGTAVHDRRNQLVDDVSQCDNYLACSEAVRSEIVVLIWRDHTIVGVIDIDSDEVGAFSYYDEQGLDQIAKLIAPVVFEVL